MFRRAPRHALLALVLVTLCLGGPRRARAEAELALSWQADTACPDEAWARERLRERLGRPLGEASSPLAARATLRHESAGFVLALHTEQAGSVGARELRAASCEELGEAAVLMIALSLEQAAPAPEAVAATDLEKPPSLAPPEIAPPPGPATRFVVRAAALGTRGDQPAWGMGGEVAAGYRLSFLELELAGFWLAPRASRTAESGGKVRMTLWALVPRLCALGRSGRLALGGCLGTELGRVGGQGRGLAQSQRNHAFWQAVSLGARLSLRVAGPVWLGAGLGAAIPLDRPRFVSVDGADRSRTGLYESKPLAGRATLGVEARF